MPDSGALGVAVSAQVSVMAPGREVNQDAHGRWAPELVSERARAGVLYVVADGVGTREAGQLASQLAVERTLRSYRTEFDGNPPASLERALRSASGAILEQAAADQARSGMASTCTAAVVHGSRLFVGHVGDSRAYLVRHGRVRQLTQDHTWAAEQSIRHGVDAATLVSHPLKSAPTRLLGTDPNIVIDLVEEPLEDGDMVILCTDGLSATLDGPAIARAVQGEDAHGAADRLVRAARTAGSSDDISVTVLVIEPVVQPAGAISMETNTRAAPARSPVSEWRVGSLALLAGIGAAAVMALLVGALGLFQLTFRDRIYPGVTALGADLGGRQVDDAARALDTQFAEYARQPITLEVAGQQFFMTAGELGVRLDQQATAQNALQIGRSGNIIRQLAEQARGLAAGRETALVYQVDDARMQTALNPLAQRVEQSAGAPRDAALLIDPSGAVRVQPSQSGRTLDRAASADLIRDRLRALGAGTLRLPTVEVPPAITVTELEGPKSVAERLLSQPLTVTATGESIQLDRSQVASILSVRKEQVDGQTRVFLRLLDGETSRLLKPLADRVARPPVHTRFTWTPGGLTVAAPGRDGQELHLPEAADALEQQALAQAGPVSLPVRPVPALGPADAPGLDIRELIADAVISAEGVDPWTRANLARALRDLHGRLVLPGQTFSLLEALGPMGVEAGYQAPADGPPIAELGPDLAASALTQAIFWSGFALEERHAPRHWTLPAGAPPRGQPGLDAAVGGGPGRDLRFTNNASRPLLIQSGLEGNSAIVALYGTRPAWEVQVGEPLISGITPPDSEPERRETPIVPVGQELWLEDRTDGFNVSIQRTVTEPGVAPRTLNLTSTYSPNRGILLVGPKPSD